jgi:hypothetical protein
MQEIVNQCLNLIIKNNVDEDVQAFRDSYFWLVHNNFPTKESYEGVLNRFLNKISQTLIREEYTRQRISEEELSKLLFRSNQDIAKVIQQFLNTTKDDGIDFLGELIGAYALAVPEPLFRVAKTYLGLHMTPDIPAIDDNLPMTDDMILHAWQYDWFYSWLGY